ncbi:SAF domain-containing protein [Fictibacillus sp. KIGAM418]|uniref:SAF domain-containing protein n=1 Tax=Fictibacillus marinisediminis TaxID=2878389 RepID=A0A9X1XEZ0_9BACL|nr:SAF domain-containing protein [Fictibacillus marinisediminis]MCK6259594.1 SAF domain-containing protein [Fictibacillus marinisediminis]
MKKMKPWVKMTIGFTIMFAVIGFVVAWDLFIKDEIDSVEVVVAAKDIPLKETITKDMLGVEKRNKGTVVKGTVLAKDMNKIIGQSPKSSILSNSIMSTEEIDYDNLVPNPDKGEAIRPIPQEWIYAKPGSLRRKDRIDIYLWPIEQKNELVKKAKGKNAPVVSPVLSEMDPDTKDGKKALLQNVPVLYAKDNSNKEVVNTEGNPEDRLNGSAIISELEVNLNQDDFDSLIQVAKAGYKLYITYN